MAIRWSYRGLMYRYRDKAFGGLVLIVYWAFFVVARGELFGSREV